MSRLLCCGCLFGARGSAEQKHAIIESNRIDSEHMKAKARDRCVIKLLMLGTGESGKSTFHKQMQLLYGQGFSRSVRENYRSIIRKNMLLAMQGLVQAVYSREWAFASKEHEEAAKAVLSVDVLEQDFWHPSIAVHVHTLWDETGPDRQSGSAVIHRAYRERNHFQISDSAEYFFNRVDTIASSTFEPTDNDILRARLRTTGIVESVFTIDRVRFQITDVGGQRNERRKWIHCFQDVTALLFVAAISEYDQVLYEEKRRNRMQESLDCFADVVSKPVFDSTAIILFLNKRDLFVQKIRQVDLNVCFPDYVGGKDAGAAMDFIKRKFLERLRTGSNHVYVHFTVATDTKSVECVWNDCRAIILRRNLEMSGLGLTLRRFPSAMLSS